jgi:hypothetical protein
MSHVNRSIFFGASAANASNNSKIVRSQSTRPTAQQKFNEDRLSGFQLFADSESSEQYLWSAAWFAMFILFLCTT